MTVRAIAYHESIAMEKLEEYFRSPTTQRSTSTRAAKCSKCNLTFAVIVTEANDARNFDYVDQLQAIITDDCRSGLHQDEYVLDTLGE
jgi:hypothetical protein